MARKARKWTSLDQELVNILIDQKESIGKTYRQLEAETGVSNTRLFQILTEIGGPPTFSEFVKISYALELQPNRVLDKVLENWPTGVD